MFDLIETLQHGRSLTAHAAQRQKLIAQNGECRHAGLSLA